MDIPRLRGVKKTQNNMKSLHPVSFPLNNTEMTRLQNGEQISDLQG